MLIILSVISGILFLIVLLVIIQRQHARRSLKQYQSLLDSIPDLAWVKDKQSRFVIVNQAFRDIWNIKDPQWLIGKDDFAMALNDGTERIRNFLA